MIERAMAAMRHIVTVAEADGLRGAVRLLMVALLPACVDAQGLMATTTRGGETKTKSGYYDDNCETYEEAIGDIKGTSRDVAHMKWGGTWRLPTKAEFDESRNNCTWTWRTQGGHAGYKVTGKNGDSI